jgi:hypothetical protein
VSCYRNVIDEYRYEKIAVPLMRAGLVGVLVQSTYVVVTIKGATLSLKVTIVAGFTLKLPDFDPLGVVLI